MIWVAVPPMLSFYYTNTNFTSHKTGGGDLHKSHLFHSYRQTVVRVVKYNFHKS